MALARAMPQEPWPEDGVLDGMDLAKHWARGCEEVGRGVASRIREGKISSMRRRTNCQSAHASSPPWTRRTVKTGRKK